MRIYPDHHWKKLQKAIKKKKAPGDDPLLALAYKVLKKRIKNQPMEEALELGNDAYAKGWILIFLVCNATAEQIKLGLGIKPEVLTNFTYLFYDKTVFRNKIDLKKYIINEFTEEKYNEENGGIEILEGLKAGLVGGVDYLIYINNPGDLEYLPNNVKILERMLQEAFFKGISGGRSELTNNVSKETLKWINTTLKLLETKEKKNMGKKDETDPLVTLEKRDKTKKLEDLSIDKKDLVS